VERSGGERRQTGSALKRAGLRERARSATNDDPWRRPPRNCHTRATAHAELSHQSDRYCARPEVKLQAPQRTLRRGSYPSRALLSLCSAPRRRSRVRVVAPAETALQMGSSCCLERRGRSDVWAAVAQTKARVSRRIALQIRHFLGSGCLRCRAQNRSPPLEDDVFPCGSANPHTNSDRDTRPRAGSGQAVVVGPDETLELGPPMVVALLISHSATAINRTAPAIAMPPHSRPTPPR